MKVSYNWLKELTGLDWPVDEAARRLTMCGTAAEEIEPTARYMDKVVVAEVVDVRPVKGASKLQLARVKISSETIDSVCGAPNVAVGQKVPLALIGARLAGDIELKPAKIKGIESIGMICSERELGISQDHSGIMVLDRDAEVGQPLVEYLNYDDYVLTFELTPNRPDSMSAIGIARDMAALASARVHRPQLDLNESNEKASDSIRVSIEDTYGCPRYAARVIRGVKISGSPWWLKARLLMSGIRPINNIVDITNYVLLECGHPLHAFDLDRFGSDEVVVRRARDGEYFTTLDGRGHELTSEVLLITNGREPVAAAGVMGGLESEVTDRTTNILLEAAYFSPSVIRKSRRVLDTVSESSSRFEKGADPNGIEYAVNRAASLMQQLCGGEVLNGVVDCYPQTITPKSIKLRTQRCNDVLGTEICEDRIKDILSHLEFVVTGSGTLDVMVPTFRPDLEREIDLIEEVARIEGYDAIPDAITNKGPLFTPRHAEDIFRDDIRRILTAGGFDEVLGHGLAESRLSEKLCPGLPQLRVLNSVSQELDIMRNSLVPGVLTVIANNIAHRNLDLRLFELGKVYFPPDDEGEWREDDRLVLAVTGSTDDEWRSQPRTFDFYDLSGAIERLAEHFHWPRLTFEGAQAPFLDKELSFTVKAGETNLGCIGRMSSEAIALLDIKQPVFMADLDLQRLMTLKGGDVRFAPLPQYPAAPRDLAIVVNDTVRAGDLVETIEDVAGGLAESIRIFDVYAGKQVEKGRKSIAVAISYRSGEGSLSSEQVDELQKKVIDRLKQKFNAVIRDK
ncbi:MAG: phenylalanine--tRNA ligase subunit beta [Candidatus Zixiibacteriota bacterium]